MTSRTVVLAGGPGHGTIVETGLTDLRWATNEKPDGVIYTVKPLTILGVSVYVGVLPYTSDLTVAEAILKPGLLP